MDSSLTLIITDKFQPYSDFWNLYNALQAIIIIITTIIFTVSNIAGKETNSIIYLSFSDYLNIVDLNTN